MDEAIRCQAKAEEVDTLIRVIEARIDELKIRRGNMDAARRKVLIAKAKEQEEIRKAIAEERQIIRNTPIQVMPPNPELAHLPKYADPDKPGERCAVDVINASRENLAKGAAIMRSTTSPGRPSQATETSKKKRGRSKKVE